MAAKGNGTSQYLATAGTLTPMTSAYTWAFWYYPLAAPSTANTKTPLSITNASGSVVRGYDLNFAWNHPTSSNTKAATHRNADLSFVVLQIGAAVANNQWIHIALTFNGSLLTIYYNGFASGTAAAAQPPGGDGNPQVSVLVYDQGIIGIGYDDAYVAEVGIWNIALSSDQVFSLYNGTKATGIGSPVFYDPLNTGVSTPVGPVLTNHSATFNTSYFFGSNGGIALGGNATPSAANYTFTMDGGIAIGGNQTIPISLAQFTSGMSASVATNRTPFFQSSYALSTALTLPSQFAGFQDSMGLKTRFRLKKQPLARGRSNAFTTK